MATFLSRLNAALADLLVVPAPRAFRKALVERLEKRDPEVVALNFNKGPTDWEEITLPDEVSGFEDLVGLFWCTPVARGLVRLDFDEAAALYRIAARTPGCRGVEIGRFRGGSTLMFSVALPADGKLTSIDIAPRADDSLRAALDRLGTADRVELLVADANTVNCPAPLDFVFIDGDHTYEGAKRDHVRWGRHVKPGGVIVHHDMGCGRPCTAYLPHLHRLRDDILANQGDHLRLREEVGSLAIFERLGDDWCEF